MNPRMLQTPSVPPWFLQHELLLLRRPPSGTHSPIAHRGSLITGVIMSILKQLVRRLSRTRRQSVERPEGDPNSVQETQRIGELLYWEVATGLRLVFGNDRFLVRATAAEPHTVLVDGPNSPFSVRVVWNARRGLFEVEAHHDRNRRAGEYEQLQATVYAVIRLIVERHQCETSTTPVAARADACTADETSGTAPKKIRAGAQWNSRFHRSGWAYAMETLKGLHSPDGVLFDGFLEANFKWNSPGRVYREPWVGFAHIPCSVPAWAGGDVSESPMFQESLVNCRGIFVLSDYHRRQLKQRVSVPISTLHHPTETPALSFSFERFRQSNKPQIIQIGSWLRHPQSFYQLQPGKLEKVMLSPGFPWEAGVRSNFPPEDLDWSSVRKIERLADGQYDELLSRNVVFLHLVDASANNTVIECIVRHTPILINRHPAVEEYLGSDYPFYFQTIEDASEKAADLQMAMRAHEYLRELPKEKLTREYFRRSLVDSEVYRALPTTDSPRSCFSVA